MSLVGFLSLVFSVIEILLTVYYWGMIIYFFMSWIPNAQGSAFGRFLHKIYEPFLAPFRKIIPPIGMIDISSIAAIFVLIFFQKGLHAIFVLILQQLA
ncbi:MULTISPECIES: YggT family protein [Staphylococcus]|uniref:YggT family protein n=1 Tax=Staphylococcus TaxID=1279 RepID=UPI000D027025|nr:MULTISPECIES: YggT family protein [Staphylococcus]MCD8914558.1 YggT family protein [Staphylococcus simulans]UXV34203.1 YggT family protein [Staphylococcus sp. IVB6181]